MNLLRLSGRQLAVAWLVGAALEAVLVLGSAGLAMRFMRREAPRFRQEAAAYSTTSARWRLGDAADSLSRERQRTEARINGTYQVQSSGETLFAIVGVPSGRPDSLAVRRQWEATKLTATAITAVIFGTLPLILLIITAFWLLAQMRNDTDKSVHGAIT